MHTDDASGPPVAGREARRGSAFGAALATDPDLAAAAERAGTRAVAALDGSAPDLAAIFVCGSEDPEVLAQSLEVAARAVGSAHVIGCTAGAVLANARGVESEPAVSVWVASLPQTTVRSFHLEVMRTDSEVAVLGVPDRRDGEDVALLLADAWSFPVDGFLARSDAALPGLGFVGGLASGPGGPGATRLLVDGRTVSRGAVGVLLGGGASLTTVVSHGCRPVGPAMVVTRASGPDILELAGQPAVERLEQLVAGLHPTEQALATTGLQLGIALDEYADSHGYGDFLIRGVIGADRAAGSLRIADELQVGQTVRFHVRDPATAGSELTETLRARASGAGGLLMFSCNGRGSTMFASADHDPGVAAGLPGHPAVGGFFAAGELGPVGGRNRLHTFTSSVLAFASAP